MAGAGDGSKTEFGQTAGKDRVMTMHMTMIMLTDRRARRVSASVLLAVYSVMLITGIAVMFRSDPPDIETDKAMDCGGTAATCGHNPFPAAGIIRHIYDTGEGSTRNQGSNTMPGTAGRGRKERTETAARTPSGKRTSLPKRCATCSDGTALTRRDSRNPASTCR